VRAAPLWTFNSAILRLTRCSTHHLTFCREQEKARKAGARKLAKEIRAKWSLAVDVRVASSSLLRCARYSS
jgi:hypothetical protein